MGSLLARCRLVKIYDSALITTVRANTGGIFTPPFFFVSAQLLVVREYKQKLTHFNPEAIFVSAAGALKFIYAWARVRIWHIVPPMGTVISIVGLFQGWQTFMRVLKAHIRISECLSMQVAASLFGRFLDWWQGMKLGKGASVVTFGTFA
jgi:hypothetical protein